MPVLALVFVALLLAGCAPTVPPLDARFEPLASDFEAARGKVRVLALLSPT